jgi:hypothetical protein
MINEINDMSLILGVICRDLIETTNENLCHTNCEKTKEKEELTFPPSL